jgi:hypothetical protein
MQSRRGKGAFILTCGTAGWKKTLAWTGTVAQPEGQGLRELLIDS